MTPGKMDYEVVKKEFKWEDVNKELDGESPRLNMAHEVCDRHAENRGKIAFFWEGKDGKSEKYSLFG